MPLLIATDAWRPQVNGVVRTLTSLSESAGFGKEIEFLTPEGFPSLPVPTYPSLRIALPSRHEIARRIEAAPPDAIHIATEGPIGWALRGYCKRNRLAFTTSYTTRFPEYVSVRTGHRLELNSDGFVIFDLLGHAYPLPWSDLTLVAEGAVRNIETSRDQAAERTGSTFGVHPNAMAAGTKLDAGSQLLLELVLTGRQLRYEINAAQFPFKYAIDRPDYSTLEKFVWLVKEICRQPPHVLMNRGARDICDGTDLVRGYDSRQLFTDEMVWLLWHHANSKQTGRS